MTRSKRIEIDDTTKERILAEHARIHAALSALPLPPGHQWIASDGSFTWFGRDFVLSASHGVSITLRKDDAPHEDPDQLSGEVRLFWSELQTFAYRPMGAIVWLQRGSRMHGSDRVDHVTEGSAYEGCEQPSGPTPKGNRHLYARDAASMIDLLVREVGAILAADALLPVDA
jgi:hypothetical protein